MGPRPFEAGLAHAARHRRVVEDLDEALGHRLLEGLRIQRGPGPVGLLVDGHQVPGLAVDDDVRDAAGRGAHDGQAQRHGLQVDDAEGLVDGGGDEHVGGVQDRGDLRLGQHLRDEDHSRALLLELGDQAVDLGRDLLRVGGARAQDELHVVGQFARRAQEVGQPLLAGDAPDEDDGALGRVDAVLGEDARLELLSLRALRGVPLRQVDAVVDDVDGVGLDARVAAQDVLAHPPGDRDDGGGGLVRRLLDEGREAVPPAQLLGLPRAQRLQRVRRDDVRDIVQQRGDVPREVRVPGVGVDQVGPRARGRDLQVDPQRRQGGVRALQLGQVVEPGHARVGALGAGLAGAVESVDAQVVHERAQHLRQF